MKKWGDRLKKVEQLAQSFQQSPLATPYKPRLWLCQPSSVWKVFPRQSVAISFAQSCREVSKAFLMLPYLISVWLSLILCDQKCADSHTMQFLGCACFCTWKRTGGPGSKDLSGHQLQWAVALLQVCMRATLHYYRYLFWCFGKIHNDLKPLCSSGRIGSPWCTAMRWLQRELFVSSTLTWSFTGPQTKNWMGKRWFLFLSR